MEIKKTVGQPGEHGKDYKIHTTCGLTFLAEREEGAATYRQFEYGIERSTLSDIKKVIEQSETAPFEDTGADDGADEIKTVFEQGPRAESLLALLFVGEQVDRELIRECLDNAGYVDPETGEIAIETAQRDIEWSA